LTLGAVKAYVRHRIDAGAANGTVNRELEVLARLLRVARKEHGVVSQLVVRDARVREADPRSGFFEADQFEAVMRHLERVEVHEVDGHKRRVRVPADDLRCACLIMYELGWRKSEVMSLERRHVNLTEGSLRLDPGTTKNREGRLAYMTPSLREAIEAQLRRLDAFQRASGRVARYLFTHTSGLHAGEPIRDFVRTWKTACRAAGISGRLRHDLRRTAARGLLNAGVPEAVAMQITGHKTASVFRRYAIVAPADLQRAARMLASAAQQDSTAQAPTIRRVSK
jgi:integrase